MTFDEGTGQLTVKPTLLCSNLANVLEAAANSTPLPSPAEQNNAGVLVTVNRITLRGTGHVSTPAEVYFKIFHDGSQLRPLGVPTREQKTSWLLLHDNHPATLNGASFQTTAPGQLRIELWDRDRSWKSWFRDEDDMLADFVLKLPVSPGSTVLKHVSGTEVSISIS